MPRILNRRKAGLSSRHGARDRFIALLRERTGIAVEVLSGEEEARLTGLGIHHALNLGGQPFVAFDLGGGTTEFPLASKQGPSVVLSVPLGAMILTQRHLVSDPPKEEVESLKRETSFSSRPSPVTSETVPWWAQEGRSPPLQRWHMGLTTR